MNKTIHELNSLAQAQADDELIIYDVSENESKKIQVQNLNNPNYSTTEQKTGGTWIDGKPIYRKVVDCGALPNNSLKTVAHNITNIDKVIKMYGVTIASNDILPLPYVTPSGISTCIALSCSSTNVNIRTGVNRTGYTTTYAIIEYTKTTD